MHRRETLQQDGLKAGSYSLLDEMLNQSDYDTFQAAWALIYEATPQPSQDHDDIASDHTLQDPSALFQDHPT